jgi:hypothetical protein
MERDDRPPAPAVVPSNHAVATYPMACRELIGFLSTMSSEKARADALMAMEPDQRTAVLAGIYIVN